MEHAEGRETGRVGATASDLRVVSLSLGLPSFNGFW